MPETESLFSMDALIKSFSIKKMNLMVNYTVVFARCNQYLITYFNYRNPPEIKINSFFRVPKKSAVRQNFIYIELEI